MLSRTRQDEWLERKRALRLRIGRSRRRIDRRLRGASDDARQLISWRTYVVRYPAFALSAALGAGMIASQALRPARVSHWLGLSLVQQSVSGIQRQLWAEILRIWHESNPES